MSILKNKKFITFAVIAVIVIILIAFFWGGYNGLVNKETKVEKYASDIDTQLQRRSDLIPNLVVVVKRYAAQEEEIFTELANARAALSGAKTMEEKANANAMADSALNRLMVIVENYPNLKSSSNFIALQDELAGTENRIAYARSNYNETVEDFNASIRKFPKNIVAAMFGFEKAEFFKADVNAKQAPVVDFE